RGPAERGGRGPAEPGGRPAAERGARRPATAAEVPAAFADRLGAGDLDGALALYEPQATFAPQPGEQVSGHEAIRGALAQFAALRPTLTGEVEKVLEADGVALVANRWTLTGTGPDGAPLEMGGVSADVMRRQPDGTWRILVDDPWGAGA
ncbi:MAG TPA: nuclear transport factor 2 family protein, partial [Solirubrobacteraceae bacterium]|nr:nuclear transport factor 2 family protein [Solirubrobacteraceae bacterium]